MRLADETCLPRVQSEGRIVLCLNKSSGTDADSYTRTHAFAHTHPTEKMTGGPFLEMGTIWWLDFHTVPRICALRPYHLLPSALDKSPRLYFPICQVGIPLPTLQDSKRNRR